jgi:hypothetical protein
MFGPCLTVALTITVTILLLGAGTLVGYHLGIRLSASSVKVVASEASTMYAAPNFELLQDAAQAVEQRSRNVAEVIKKHRESMPPELMMAIDQLVAVTTKFGRQLQQASTVTRGQSSNTTERLPCSVTKTTTNIAAGMQEQLTGKEMQHLAGLPTCDDVAKRRYPYHCRQTIYPIIGSQPDSLRAIHVRCHDISVNGVSFFLAKEPDFERLVISLGSEEDPLLMEAEVVQSKLVYMHDDWQTLVGCRLTARHTCQIPLRAINEQMAGSAS